MIKKKKAMIATKMKTMIVLTTVSLRVGQVTLEASCLTCRRNCIGLGLAIVVFTFKTCGGSAFTAAGSASPLT